MKSYLDSAKQVFQIETDSLKHVAGNLDRDFDRAVEIILRGRGKCIVSGMGKSGHIGQKIAATFASTGTPGFFVHPAEAFHGDLGMIEKADVILLISYSGETDEVLKIIPFLKHNGNTIIAISGNPGSTLARHADIHLNISVPKEACPLALAPTSSTTATLVMGDALAIALMDARAFKPEEFARFHPGGSLGRRLLHTVEDYMRKTDLPFMDIRSNFRELVIRLSEGKLGLVIVQDEGKTVGIITDGDLRRALNTSENPNDLKPVEMLTEHPVTVPRTMPIHEAEKTMVERKISALLVEEDEEIIGVCQLYTIVSDK
jgi:arabinose-5-phosphate isomerase